MRRGDGKEEEMMREVLRGKDTSERGEVMSENRDVKVGNMLEIDGE